MKIKTVQEIKAIINTIESDKHPFIIECEKDERKGVQSALNVWRNGQMQLKRLKQQFEEMNQYERELYHNGVNLIAGIDEVGRGPLAGPLVAAAVILPRDFYLLGLTDSKQVSEKKREMFFDVIQKEALSIGISIIPSAIIDEVNIYQATKIAMKKAVHQLSVKPEHLLVDAMEIPIDIPQQSIIKGDAKSISIAASSIVAKVTRDRYMKRLSQEHSQYGFDKNMGYGTKQHIEALQKHGIIKEHRRSFSPIKEFSEDQGFFHE